MDKHIILVEDDCHIKLRRIMDILKGEGCSVITGNNVVVTKHCLNNDSRFLSALILPERDVNKAVRSISNIINYENELTNSNIKNENIYKHALDMLALASMYKDPETGDHIKRIVRMTKELALEMGIEADLAEQMGTDSILHDLGKVGIPDHILLKPGKLSESEFEIMKQHTLIGARIMGEDEWFYQASQIALSHHERWDGSGYPEGLKNDDIPFAARIVAVTDVFDALISKRPYKEPWPLKKAIYEIKKEAGKHFDPKIIKAFLSLYRKGTFKQYDSQKYP